MVKGGELFAALEAMSVSAEFLPAAISVLLCFCVSMVTVAAPSVSVECKNLWLVKSLPVSGFDILEAKALCHIIVTVPFAIVSGVIAAVALKANILQSIQLVTLPCAVTVFGAYFGVTVNLKFPKFDWISEIHCVKQSVSVVVSMFGMMGVIIAAVVIYAAGLRHLAPVDLCVLLYTVIFVFVGMLLRRWLKNKGTAVFEEIQG